MHANRLIVKSLLCHQHVKMALMCFESLKRNCYSAELSFSIHDDGSLTADDCAILRSSLSAVEFINRQEADDLVQSSYRSYPLILNLRRSNPLLLKAIDIPLLSTSEWTFYVDSDIYWFRPFSLFDINSLEASRANLVMMRDRSNCYSLRSWQLLLSSIRLPSCGNSGFLFYKTKYIDIEYLNWFVGPSHHHGIPSMIEQTYFAALATRVGGSIVHHQQLKIMRDHESATPDLIAGHFTARSRHLLPQLDLQNRVVRNLKYQMPMKPPQLTVQPLGACTSWALFTNEVSRLAIKSRSLFSSKI